ncbi:MAG: RDD family protein [bacterium]
MEENTSNSEILSPLPVEAKEDKPFVIYAGFWRRVAALIIDVIVLALFGALLLYLYFEIIAKMGYWGFVIGAVISGTYYTLCWGELGKGRTVGKLALNIRVVTKDGGILKYNHALLRFLIFNAFFLVQALNIIISISGNQYVVGISLFLFLIPILIYILAYGLVVFHPQKRGLHDILAGTYVVRSKFGNEAIRESIDKAIALDVDNNKTKKAIVKTLLTAFVVIGGLFCLVFIPSRNVFKEGPSLNEMMEIRSKAQKKYDITISGVTFNHSYASNENSFVITIVTSKEPEKLEGVMDGIKDMCVKNPRLKSVNAIVFRFVNEVNIGIFRFTKNQTRIFSLDEKNINEEDTHKNIMEFNTLKGY